MYGRSFWSNMYGPNIAKTGVHSPPEAIYILSKENVFIVLKGEGMAYLIHITIQIWTITTEPELKTKMKPLIIVDYF